jgi:all-trans-retinol dehydrogenase (NAD+)
MMGAAVGDKVKRKKDVQGKVFLVTGGAMGMGRLVAEHFARDGARVVLWDINAGELEKTVRQMTEREWEVYPYVVDVTDRALVYETAERVKEEVGAVDVLFNNAGIVKGGSFMEVDDEVHYATMDVNFNAYMWMTKAFMGDMMSRGEGHIINIASAAGLTHVPMATSYAASKAAVVNFTDSLRHEMRRLGHKGVKFTIVCPSYVTTGMFEGVKAPLLVPWLEPQKMADKIYQAYHSDKKMVAEPAFVKIVPALRGLAPRWLYERSCTVLGVSRSMEDWRGH